MNGRGLHSVDSDDPDDPNADENDTAIRAEDYVVVKPLELSNDVFKCLLGTLNSRGIVYTLPKGKGREVTSETAPSTSSDDPMGENADSETDQPSTLAPDPPLSSEHLMTEDGGSKIGPALLVSVHRPGLGYSHVVFQVDKTRETRGYKPLTALYFYQSLRSSHDLQLRDVNRLVDRMLPALIRLATSRSPVTMEQKFLYNHPSTGFRQLGHWEQLEAMDTMIAPLIEPVVESDEKRRLLSINGLDETLDMYVLYIWTEVSVIAEEQQGFADIIYRIIPRHRR